MDRDVHWGRLVPKHGPGSVADRLRSNAKWDQRSWPARLQPYFPAVEYLVPNAGYQSELDQGLNIVEPGAETPVRVITVPKTLKTPRIIAIEPTAMQYVQQAVSRALRDAVLEDDFLSRVVSSTDQAPNRVMARRGSQR
uniref:RNA-dependent RNA polymerase n=1 Tax=Leviviridae sp. TaxID=2027243 RepID=A0A514D5C0_9VIRU|nr:MAG: RNA-dependent RNA polymerase [Leviviridae sp.]